MPAPGARKLTSEQEDAVCAGYAAGTRSGLLADQFGVSGWTVRATLARRGIQRGRCGASWRRKLHPFSEDYFARIDTPQKAYWLGFLHADGCIANGVDVRLSLGHVEDGPHVGCFLRSIGLTRPYLTYHYPHLNKRAYVGIARSAEMAADLNRLGIATGKRTWPEIDEALEGAFCLGLFDGDGSWMKSRAGRIIASFVADPVFAGEFAAAVRRHTGFEATPKPYHPKVSYVRYSSDGAVGALAHWFYSSGATVYLPRKRRRVERWVGAGDHRCPV